MSKTRPAVVQAARVPPPGGDSARWSGGGETWPWWFVAGIVFGAALLAYQGGFSGPFLLDDLPAIRIGNPTILKLWPWWDVLSPPATAGVGGRPLVNLSFALNYAWGGVDVAGYHAVNLALHAAAALALFGVVRRTLRLPSLRDHFGAGAGWLALGVALLWLLHPLQTEAVTYISQRSELLMGLFYFLTLYGFIRSAAASTPWPWQVCSVLACFLGALSKEIIATAPLVVVLFDRTFVAGSFREAWKNRAGYYVALMTPWLLLAWLMRDVAQRGVGFSFPITAGEYARTSCRSIVHYLALAVWPHPLVFDYGTGVARHFSEVAPQVMAVVGLVAATGAALRWRPAAGFLGAWVLLTLAPTTSFVPVAMQPMAEHRMYLPLAACVTTLVLGARAWLTRQNALALTAALIAASVAGTTRRNADYRSELAIWNDTVAKCPANVRARVALGSALVDAGRLPEACGQFEAALRLDPAAPDIHLNYGNALFLSGRKEAAVVHYELVVQARPTFAEGRYNLGNALLALGRSAEAAACFEATARLDFDNAELHHRLGEAFLGLRRLPEAIRQYEATLTGAVEAGDPSGPARTLDSHLKLAALLAETGAIAQAIPHYETALQLRPDDAAAHNDLGAALIAVGRWREARPHLETALRLDPTMESARELLHGLSSR